MQWLLETFAHGVEEALDLLSIVLVVIGSLHAVVRIARWRPGHTMDMRAIWVELAHWLVAALTFELAADIVSTTVAPSWTDLGKLSAIAVIRTFLTYFLDRDLEHASSLAE